MRVIVSIMIMMMSLLISRELYTKSVKEAKLVEDMSTAVERMISYIKYGSYDVFTICQLAISELESFDIFDTYAASSFKDLWADICNDISVSERSIFMSVGDILGAFDSETQIKRLEYILTKLRERCSERKQKLADKKRVCYTVGCFLGLMLIIIVI